MARTLNAMLYRHKNAADGADPSSQGNNYYIHACIYYLERLSQGETESLASLAF